MVQLPRTYIAFGSNVEEVVGRVSSIRTAGSKLAFIDLVDHSNNERLQIVVNNGQLEGQYSSVNHVKAFTKLIRRGDTVCTYEPKLSAGGTDDFQLSLVNLIAPEQESYQSSLPLSRDY